MVTRPDGEIRVIRGGLIRAICALVAAGLALSCSKDSDSPTGPGDIQTLSGRTVNALDDAQSGNVSIRIGQVNVQSDAAGFFQTEVPNAGWHPAALQSNGFVERLTGVDAPASGLRLSLIPTSFDMTAFNEMLRSETRLKRWVTRPRLVVLTSVMRFSAMRDDTFFATDEKLSGSDVESIVSDMRNALALLTSGTFTDFSVVDREAAAPAQAVLTTRTGAIVVGRYSGIQDAASTIGYGRWAAQSDGSIVGGSVYLDRDFDVTSIHRVKLRTHELGHALGYMHVTATTSIMNPTIGPEPTTFDRQAVRIAFDRQPGNRAPDEDPAYTVPRTSITDGSVRWSAPIP
jgi:hypothetical protein